MLPPSRRADTDGPTNADPRIRTSRNCINPANVLPACLRRLGYNIGFSEIATPQALTVLQEFA
jgi:hypothetical protein